MRPVTFEEREHLLRLSHGVDLLDFVAELNFLGRKHRMSHAQLLSVFANAPGPTDVPERDILRARNELAETGFELTPDEVLELLESGLHKVRQQLRRHGYPDSQIPASDVELLKIFAR